MIALGIDVGGSGIKGALVDTASGELTSERLRLKTPRPSKPEAVIGRISRLVEKIGFDGPIGVGFPTVVRQGVVRSAANIDKSWIGYPGQEEMSRATGCPVTLLNDADAAGTAEMKFGAGQGERGLVMIITLGTGIGTALFSQGILVPNTELGHLYLPGQMEDAESTATDRARTEGKLGWKVWAGQLNEYLSHLERLFSPDLFILGGGVSKKQEKFIPLLRLQARVAPAVLRNEAGIVGAALAAAQKSEGGME
jgi:polyphosphate glucokinase